MKSRGIVRAIICAALASGLLVKAYATDRQSSVDVRCILVAMHMASSGVPVQRGAAMMVAMYYFGRLDDRSPHADIEQLIETEAGKMTLAELRASAARCGKALEEKSHEFARIGADLARKGQSGATLK